MRRIIIALSFIFSFTAVFANEISKEEITKYALKDNASFIALTQVLTQTQQQISDQQNSNTQKQAYQAILKEVNQALQKAVDTSLSYYEKYKNNKQMSPEYINSFKKDIETFKNLQTQQIDRIIADYAKANFDITKLEKLRAFCFSGDQIRLDFVYEGKNGQIVYICSGKFVFHVVSENRK